MNRILVLILVVFSCTTGCIAVNSRALTASADALQDQDAPLASSRQSDADNAPVMVSLRRGELDFDILPIGSYVSIDCEQDHKYQGTVVHRTQSRLELANCLRKSPVVSEEGLTQLATQCVPLQVVDKPTVTGLKIMSLPSRKLDPTKLRFEGDDTEVVALEFHSGRVQRWIEPPIEADFSRDNHSAEEMVRAVKDIAAGSQIAFTDQLGNRYNALVSSTTSQRVNLRVCVQNEVIKRRDGHEANCLSILPISSWGVESISSFSVVAPPPPDFNAAEFDSGCELCIEDVIYKSGRRQSQWKLARDDARMMKFFDTKARPVMERKLASAGWNVAGAEAR